MEPDLHVQRAVELSTAGSLRTGAEAMSATRRLEVMVAGIRAPNLQPNIAAHDTDLHKRAGWKVLHDIIVVLGWDVTTALSGQCSVPCMGKQNGQYSDTLAVKYEHGAHGKHIKQQRTAKHRQRVV